MKISLRKMKVILRKNSMKIIRLPEVKKVPPLVQTKKKRKKKIEPKQSSHL
jgi:hypothetical protein